MRKLACFCDGVMELELEEGGAGGAELRRGTLKKKSFLSRLVLPTGTKGCLLSRLPDPGQKSSPFCPGIAFPVGKPGQKKVSQPGQIKVFVVVTVTIAKTSSRTYQASQ